MRRRNQGFIVGQLFVILVAATLLVMMTLPMIKRFEERRDNRTCLENMQKLGTAFRGYLEDWDGTLPCSPVQSGAPVQEAVSGNLRYNGEAPIVSPDGTQVVRLHSIRAQLSPYLHDSQAWRCPCDESCDPGYRESLRWTSYPYRYLIAGQRALPGFKRLWKETDFRSPGAVFVFNEVMPFHDRRQEYLSSVNSTAWAKEARMNFAFLDGHAASYAVGSILAPSPTPTTGYDCHWSRNGGYAGRFLEVGDTGR